MLVDLLQEDVETSLQVLHVEECPSIPSLEVMDLWYMANICDFGVLHKRRQDWMVSNIMKVFQVPTMLVENYGSVEARDD